jgi:membrane protein required for colicin V production
MNPLDIAILAILIVSAIYSTWRGFVRDIFSLVGIGGGLLLAARFYPEVSEHLRPWVETQWLAVLIACGIIFLTTWLAISILGRMVSSTLRVLSLGWLDRTAGFCFGILKALIISVALVVVLVEFLPAKTPFLSESRLAPALVDLAREVGKRIPGKAGEWLGKIKMPEDRGGPKQQVKGAKKGERGK